jgi:kynurenine formamidase
MRTHKFYSDSRDVASPERREFLKTAAAGAVAATVAGGAGTAAAASASEQLAQGAETPIGAKWWPSRWGAGDEAGASNWITPQKVLDSARWIRDGKIYRIGRVYEAGMPLFGSRAFSLRIPGTPTGGPFGENKLIFHDEFLATEIGQVGTQFDGLGHIGVQAGKAGDMTEMRYYNGFTEAEMASAYGLQKLGIEHCKPFFTRAHLVDVEGLRGSMWDAGQEIRLADMNAALQRQNMSANDIQQGDGVFFNTGWGSLWMKNNDRFNSGAPGIGMEVARFLAEREISVTGADTWPTEVVPNPDSKLAFVVHNELITRHGIFNHENMRFDDLIADRKYQFVYVFSPVPIKGGTGSPGGPIAIT